MDELEKAFKVIYGSLRTLRKKKAEETWEDLKKEHKGLDTRFKVEDLVIAKYAMGDESHIPVSRITSILNHKRYLGFCKGCQLKGECKYTKKGALLIKTNGDVNLMCEWQVEPATKRDTFAYYVYGADVHEDK